MITNVIILQTPYPWKSTIETEYLYFFSSVGKNINF